SVRARRDSARTSRAIRCGAVSGDLRARCATSDRVSPFMIGFPLGVIDEWSTATRDLARAAVGARVPAAVYGLEAFERAADLRGVESRATDAARVYEVAHGAGLGVLRFEQLHGSCSSSESGLSVLSRRRLQ